ncbi:RNA dependent RNA polymerase-domain-containing protein [Macrophomina phaseolina]|uniref:RNA-dependent RNA polymerase n=1 Tax=Macrophomina phaseolina TaxID=35725 RepID=A0ABQ8G7F8_9PEZI|nr:RNA dependent RNA polymerase-domain-containing protein [Macrophomina phaseolina]
MYPQLHHARPYVHPLDDSPRTPGGEHHVKINEIIESLTRKYRLPLVPRDPAWSPSRTEARKDEPAIRCASAIKYLYYKSRELLDQTIRDFDAVAQLKPHRDHLSQLCRLLEEAQAGHLAQSKLRAGRTTLLHRLEELAPTSSRSTTTLQPAPSSVFNRPHLSKGSTAKVPLNDENCMHSQEAELEPTQPDTPTTTEGEERVTSPPQSPSLRASRRRQELSRPAAEDQAPRSRRQHRAKGSSDASTDSESSSKQRRTSVETSFAMPEAPRTRAKASRSSTSSSTRPFATTSATTSTTSFASTVLSRSDSVFSDPRENTADTSFATSVFPSQSAKPQQVEEFHSFGTFSSDFDFDQAIENAKAATSVAAPSYGTTKPLGDLVRDSEEELLQHCPNVPSPSKAMEQHQVRDLPMAGLFGPKTISARLQGMSFKYRWEFMRVALEAETEPDSLLPPRDEWQDYAALWGYLKQHAAAKHCVPRLEESSPEAWSAAEATFEHHSSKAFENVTLRGLLSFNGTTRGPLFKIRLQSLQTEKDSCRFQRAFGGDRFLYLETPPLKNGNVPGHLKGQEQNIADRFEDWLTCERKEFLGREWEVIHVEPFASKKQSLQRQHTETRGYRVILFATKGCDIDTRKPRKIRSGIRHEMTVFDLINWFMPLAKNSHQPYLKAFARISLGLTATTPTLQFKPSQVRYVTDIVADGELEDPAFNDKSLVWRNDKRPKRVMNDGCSLISVGAARKLWEQTNRTEPLPSTFQGRIGGAKGMWMISDSPDTTDSRHLKVWIQISDSQLKFKAHSEDQSESEYDPHRLTFDLHSTTGTAGESSVYLSFFPILENRGVSAKALQKLFESHLDREREKILASVTNRVGLRTWLNQQNSLAEERNRDENMTWQASMPLQLHEKAILLAESGFDISCDYLADVAHRLLAKSLRLLRQNIRVPLPRCTYIKGVADPLGVLKPGEIHVHFTRRFVDEVSGDCLSYLNNRNVLVARNPALRASDIQKVRSTFNLRLGHLKDVVVFPTRGTFPLAGKLQGGDYDGDTFWVCWEPEMVEPFKNAPPPLEDPDPKKCQIKVDKRKLADMCKGDSISEFLRESFKFRCKPSLLGQATKFHERLVYMEGSLATERSRALADLHDLLVDYSKNGYEFDKDDFDSFKRMHGLPLTLRRPKYETARENDCEATKTKARSYPISNTIYSRKSILDRLYFETIEPHTRKTLTALEDVLKRSTSTPDPDLEAPYLAELAEANDDPEIADELSSLRGRLQQLIRLWNEKIHTRSRHAVMASASLLDALDDPDTYNAAVDACYRAFCALMPVNAAASPVIRRWHREEVNHGPCTYWELLRASALYHVWMGAGLKGGKGGGPAGNDSTPKKRKSTFAFNMAGMELCWIKAARTGCRPMVHDIWTSMKPRSNKKKRKRKEERCAEEAGRSSGVVRQMLRQQQVGSGERRFGTGRFLDDDDDGDDNDDEGDGFGMEEEETAYESAMVGG